ncbi:GIY-YIG nuclease family protein [Paraburkholderia sediminicola]|uniref:GIY-YIG nuclease family protein n=1 Tax=Paraburkholderia sediminicola TaxID=458836 RepID=UPI0038BC917B
MEAELKIFYVYALYREDGITPFYIGKGKGARWTHHERWAKRGRSHKDNIICEIKDRGVSVPRVKLHEGLTDMEARALEIELIAKIGRYPNGPLTNLTAGGDGVIDLPKEVRQRVGEMTRLRQLGVPLSVEHRAKLSAAKKGIPFSEKHRENLKAARALVVMSPETNMARSKAIGAAHKGRVMTEEHRRKLSEAAKRRMQNPSELEKFRAASIGRKHTPEAIEKNRLAHVGRRHSTETLAKKSEAMKRVWAARKGVSVDKVKDD